MKALRWLASSLLSVVGGLVMIVGAILCGTVVLAPVGILLILVARRLLAWATRLVVPRRVRHPAEALKDSIQDASGEVSASAHRQVKRARRRARAGAKRLS